MDRTDTMINDISAILRTAGESLAENPKDLSPVRRMQQKLVGLPSRALDPRVRFLVFFLCNFVDDVFFNLVGDLPPSKEIERIERTFFGYFGGILQELANHLIDEAYEQCHPTYVKLVTMYLDKVDELSALDGM